MLFYGLFPIVFATSIVALILFTQILKEETELSPLHIIIRSVYAEHCSVISVEDTGRGYAPSQDSSTHIGIHNVRERLSLMCNGTLTISAREGGGTVVTIRIPDQKKRV